MNRNVHVPFLEGLEAATPPGYSAMSKKEQQWHLVGILLYNMMRKGQLQDVAKGDMRSQGALVAKLFGVVA